MRKPLLWAGIIITVFFLLLHFGTSEPEKPAEPPLDYSKPVYTIDRAIVCPLGVLVASNFDVRADHGPEAIVALYTSLFGRESREKTLGCEEWRGGVKVETV
jgi:hypothetical protein